jgi:hypothetical protein
MLCYVNGMNLKIVSVAMAVAIAIAAVSAVGVLTSMSFVQQAKDLQTTSQIVY